MKKYVIGACVMSSSASPALAELQSAPRDDGLFFALWSIGAILVIALLVR